MSKFFEIDKINLSKDKLFLIAGPCVLEENCEVELKIVEQVQKISERLDIPFIFKASYTKANRTSANSYRGVGIEKGLKRLLRVKKEFGVPVLSDIHEVEEIKQASEVLDILQIPAFLCRQTSLLEGAASSGCAVNIKKGQFMSPWDMKHAVSKVSSTSNKVMVTERGACFGYNNLVVDMRTFPVMKEFGCPVVFDGTHSVQLPGGGNGQTSGQRHMILPLVRAAVAAGCHGLFLEVHPDPSSSPSDSASILPISQLESVLTIAKQIHTVVHEQEGKRVLFGDIVRSKNFATLEDVEKALTIQRKMDEDGEEHKLLGIIMLEQGMLNSDQLLELLKDLEEQQGVKHY
ncbi:3-deoxy-8-phosphooctulonate synthase [Candidatus Uabimicrobium sp. HlEnr_7]|uniref:3-deoxy-8-phosphooctulonate synthase n=1 Tax=Candidatus Uabimicrobium helgolandensis TaxID=3095367 RepID=UPI003556AD71